MELYILDADKKPVQTTDMAVYSAFMSDFDNRCVSQMKINGGFRVSTVFLGVNCTVGTGAPILWETMVFKDSAPSGKAFDRYRYTSYHNAVIGHFEMVARWNKRTVLGKTCPIWEDES